MTEMELTESQESSLCRLCGILNQNGTFIFSEANNGSNLSVLINKYLPIKVENDGKYPDRICPGCEIQLEATKLFFDLIIEGQNQLKFIFDKMSKAIQVTQAEDLTNISSQMGTLEIQSVETGEKYFIQIMDNTLNEDPLYSNNHEIVTNMNILNREKRKRGRPKKHAIDKEKKVDEADINKQKEISDNTDNNNGEDGKRQRKIPARFSETVRGKELDEILKKEGIDEEDFGSDSSEMMRKEPEIIGRIENKDGEEPAQPVVISKSFNVNRNKRTGLQKTRKRKKYKCDLCSEQFRNYPRLRVHMDEIHKNEEVETREENTVVVTSFNDGETEVINEINQKITNSSDLTCEENSGQKPIVDQNCQDKIVNNQQSFNCELCDKVYKCKQNLRVHMEGVHGNTKPFTCSECKQNFTYAKSLRVHQLKHKRGIYPCEECQKKFNHPSSLLYHRNAEHNNGKRFVCNKCDKTFKHRQLLHRHQLVHSEERPFKCDLCTSAFKTRTNLMSHSTIHTGERNFSCTECGQTFAHKTSLNLHIRWHSGEKPFTCEFCSKSFSQKGNLVEHQRIHTGEKPYCCDVCGRNFTTSSQLRLHTKRHTGERPWKCEFCSRSFLHKESWKDHYRRHMNDRPYKCQLCTKAFTALHCLRKHMRFHTGEKPFSCDICLKGFSNSSNLTKHRRTHEQKYFNQNEAQVSLLNTDADNNLFYVYYNSQKEQDPQVSILGLDQPQSEVVVNSDNDAFNFKEDALQFQQLVDQEGNPLSLNTQDGQQINVVTSITNGQEKLQGLLPDGTLVAIDLQDSKVESMESVVDPAEEETSVSHLLLDGSMTFLSDHDNKPDNNILVTEQPNICFVTYDPNTGDIIQ